MTKQTFNIIDNVFAHDKYAVAGQDASSVVWDRALTDKAMPTFYSHDMIPRINHNVTDKDNSYGLLFESRAIAPHAYQTAEGFMGRFNLVFTHSSKLLSEYSNARWIPGGGIWVGGTYGKGDIKIGEKNKLCSMVTSNKTMCPLHRFRLVIADELSTNTKVDIFRNNWIPINETLENYMFSIVVENFQDELYFTEKLLNCFATGTVPIYLGSKNIGDKFNLDGILRFNNMDELNEHLENISEDLYHQKKEAINDNFLKCLEFKTIEDYIYNNYFKK
jgi:hypothetical protein